MKFITSFLLALKERSAETPKIGNNEWVDINQTEIIFDFLSRVQLYKPPCSIWAFLPGAHGNDLFPGMCITKAGAIQAIRS
jgi:hypothetical protein